MSDVHGNVLIANERSTEVFEAEGRGQATSNPLNHYEG